MEGLPVIEAAVVNHNTSAFTELMLRSLFAAHPGMPNLRVRVYDNASTDDGAALRAYAAKMGVAVLQSGFGVESKHNSHGEVLRSFVMENPVCDYYLFLDADAVFVERETIQRMLRELQAAPDAFGANPTMSWDGVEPYSGLDAHPEVYTTRIHPFCALVKNTALFRSVVEAVGLSCVHYLWADREEYLDTFKLMTRVMLTHGLRHIITTPLVIHFFSVSYEGEDAAVRKVKADHRDALLRRFRAEEPATTGGA